MRLVMCDAKLKKIFHFPPNISKIFHKFFNSPIHTPSALQRTHLTVRYIHKVLPLVWEGEYFA